MTLEEFYADEAAAAEERRKTMYRCLTCGAAFTGEDAKEYDEVIGDFWGTPALDTFRLCPHCDNEDVVKMRGGERKYKIWGGDVEEKDALYIWAKDADEAFHKIAREIDKTVTSTQWTGEEYKPERGSNGKE